VTLIGTTEAFAHVSLRLIGYRARRVHTSVGRVHVLDGKGEGTLPGLVLLHGFSAAAIHYATLMRHLRPHVRRLVVPDFPAHGRSDTPEPITTRCLRQGLFEALDEVLEGRPPAVLFGNSMGGHAAVMYARTRPERVAGLILCSPGGAPMEADELVGFARQFDLSSYAQALQFVDRLFMRKTLLRSLVALGVKQKFGHPNMRRLIGSLTVGDLLRPDDLRGLEVPTLVIWGRADHIMPESHVEFFRRNLPPGGRLEEPDHFTHSPYLDLPQEVARRILAFVTEVDGARRKSEVARDRVLDEEHGARVAGAAGDSR